jgi:mono/diheme cytochrome c family protein/cytochrome c553
MKIYALLGLWTISLPLYADDPAKFFQERVQPVLVKNCSPCHTTNKLGGLQLDSKEHVLSGGKSGPAITPGDPEHSLLVRAISYNSEIKMPPQGKLTDGEIADITAWVRSGAFWPAVAGVSSRDRRNSAEGGEFFEMYVRPILAQHCYSCHTQTRMGGLQLDSREHAFAGGKDGAVIVPGDPARSLLFRAISYNEERKMPPSARLKDEEIATIKTWISRGAIWPEEKAVPSSKGEYVISKEQRAFWSFQPVKMPALPAVKNRQWLKSPIDQFILAALEAKNLTPVKPADKRALIRRVTLDLTGLPPTPGEVDNFLNDSSPDAYAKVVDRLLASPHYGERWARYWLDVARYSDDQQQSGFEVPYPAAYRYRDWVIQAFNEDLPYDQFIQAQLAGDQMPCKERAKCIAGLGMYALSPAFEGEEDRVDVTTRGFLGLTVACAQCHDHKFDPIPTKDYYSLLGVFTSTRLDEYPLAPAEVVKAYKAQKAKLDDRRSQLKELVDAEAAVIAQVLAKQTADYLMAAKGDAAAGLDEIVLARWKKYLQNQDKPYLFLKQWFATGSREAALEFQHRVVAVLREKKEVDEKNRILLGLTPKQMKEAILLSLERDRFILWHDLFGEGSTNQADGLSAKAGLLRFGEKDISRYLSPLVKASYDSLREEITSIEKAMPPQYPFLQVIRDIEKPHDEQIRIRGSIDNLGEVAPRRFLSVLSNADSKPFFKGSGRLELAEAIASPSNPLTARVMVNRIWQHHFGQGIVRTPSNFGQMGERPSHPELLDYLASRFVENGWSMKKLHREILLSATYQLSTEYSEKNFAVDPGNQLLWRANRHRMDIEALRDSLLFVSGNLDFTPGGPPEGLKFARQLSQQKQRGRANSVMNEDDRRRAVYNFVSRRKLDPVLSLFDFPNPNSTSEQRIETNVPLQRLFFLNSEFMNRQAQGLAAKVKGHSDSQKIQNAYNLLYSRPATEAEVQVGLRFMAEGGTWQQYAQALLSSNEFIFVN